MSPEALTNILPAQSFSHSCIVVADIEKTYAAWQGVPGAECSELKQTNSPDIAQVVYRGKSSPTVARQFFVTAGGLRTEVLQPDEHPSIWAEMLKRQGGDSLHHMGYDVDDAEPIIRFFEEQGMGVLQAGKFIGGRYVYLDTQDALGMIIELIERC